MMSKQSGRQWPASYSRRQKVPYLFYSTALFVFFLLPKILSGNIAYLQVVYTVF